MKKCIFWVCLLFISLEIHAQQNNNTLSEIQKQEELNRLQREINKLEIMGRQLSQSATDLANERKFQCLKSMPSLTFCECLTKNLPWVLSFRDYIYLITSNDEEVKSIILKSKDPNIQNVIEKTKLVREKCSREL